MSEGSAVEARSSFPAGARCAHHPERAAQNTCVRCGNYMCAECVGQNDSAICLACASRSGEGGAFPYTRDDYTFDGLLNLALSRWKQHWMQFALAYLATLAITYIPAFAFGAAAGLTQAAEDHGLESRTFAAIVLQGAGQILLVLVQLTSHLVLFGYCLDILENRPTDWLRALQRVRALPALLLQWLMVYGGLALLAVCGYAVFRLLMDAISVEVAVLSAALGVLLLLPVLIYGSLGLVFTILEFAHNPEATAISAMRMSWQLAAGRRSSIAGVLFVSGIIGAAGMLACCIGLLASMPISMLLYAALFLALQAPTERKGLAVAHEWPV